MKSTLFTKSFKCLIIALLLFAVLFNRKLSQQLMLTAILVWIVLAVCLLFGSNIRSLLSFANARYTGWKAEKEQMAAEPKASTAEAVQELPAAETSAAPVLEPTLSGFSDPDQKRMLQHISLRITEKIKSAYPEATWQWESSPCLSEILSGNSFRITTDSMDCYTHADIHFDQFARIRITPLIIGEFATPENIAPAPDTEEAKEPPIVDVQSWYELLGRQVLETVITDLNAGGHRRLSIKENGDIIITRNKKEALKGTLEHFPPKNYWNEFLHLLEEDELQGKAEKDHIVISWT